METKKPEWIKALEMFARLSTWIVFPVLIGALIGSWLDKKYNGNNFIFLGVIGLAFIVSMFGLVKNANKEYKKIDGESKKIK